MRGRGLLLTPLAALLVSCGIGGGPDVTFAAGGTTVETGPSQYCEIDLTGCDEDEEAGATLPVPPGTPVRITVPEEIGETPWQVVFRFRQEGADEPVDGRSRVFAAGEGRDYTLEVPDGARLERVEVQQFGLPANVGGEATFRIRGTWELTVN